VTSEIHSSALSAVAGRPAGPAGDSVGGASHPVPAGHRGRGGRPGFSAVCRFDGGDRERLDVRVGRSGSRDPTTTGYGAIEYHRVIQATFAVFGMAAIASYLLKVDLPRSCLLVMMPVGLAALLAARFGARRWLHRRRDTGRYLSRVLALGTVDTVTELLGDLRRAPRAGYAVLGVCLGHSAGDAGETGGVGGAAGAWFASTSDDRGCLRGRCRRPGRHHRGLERTDHATAGGGGRAFWSAPGR